MENPLYAWMELAKEVEAGEVGLQFCMNKAKEIFYLGTIALRQHIE
jgi:hypothetical protein